MGYNLAEGKGLREGWDSKELWKSVEKLRAPPLEGATNREESVAHIATALWLVGIPRFGPRDNLTLSIVS